MFRPNAQGLSMFQVPGDKTTKARVTWTRNPKLQFRQQGPHITSRACRAPAGSEVFAWLRGARGVPACGVCSKGRDFASDLRGALGLVCL